MKKLFLSFAVIASLGLVSCGGNKAAEENAEAPAEGVEVVEEAVEEASAEEAAPAEGETAEAPAEEAPAEEAPAA